MSPYERKVFATIERELRDEDPELAAVLDRTASPPFSTSQFALSIRHVLLLLGALVGLIAVYTLLPGRLDLVGLATLTAVAVVPWLVVTVWSAERRSRTAGGTDGRPGNGEGNRTEPPGSVGRLRAKRRALLAVVTVLVALALVFPAAQPVVALALTLLAANFLPWLVVRVVEWFERSDRSPRS